MDNITKKYTNGEVTVVWKPEACIHSGICIRGLSDVFDRGKRPWVSIGNASTEKIIAQVEKCPSAALSYYLNNKAMHSSVKIEAETIVETVKDGPLLVYGNVVVKDNAGNLSRKHNVTAFCRCGASQNKPYCDGTHEKNGFHD